MGYSKRVLHLCFKKVLAFLEAIYQAQIVRTELDLFFLDEQDIDRSIIRVTIFFYQKTGFLADRHEKQKHDDIFIKLWLETNFQTIFENV